MREASNLTMSPTANWGAGMEAGDDACGCGDVGADAGAATAGRAPLHTTPASSAARTARRI